MIYYLFESQIFTLYLGSALSVVTLPSKVYDYVGANKGELKVTEVNKGRSLVFESKLKDKSSFVIFTKDKRYHLNLLVGVADKDIEIKQAYVCSMYTVLKREKDYSLFECPKSLYLVPKKRVFVNERFISKASYLSKGPPLWINKQLVYYKGVQ